VVVFNLKKEPTSVKSSSIKALLVRPIAEIHKDFKLFFLKSETNKTLCEPADFVDLEVNIDDEYFLEPYVENLTPW
jgi:hypothetical protein